MNIVAPNNFLYSKELEENLSENLQSDTHLFASFEAVNLLLTGLVVSISFDKSIIDLSIRSLLDDSYELFNKHILCEKNINIENINIRYHNNDCNITDSYYITNVEISDIDNSRMMCTLKCKMVKHERTNL